MRSWLPGNSVDTPVATSRLVIPAAHSPVSRRHFLMMSGAMSIAAPFALAPGSAFARPEVEGLLGDVLATLSFRSLLERTASRETSQPFKRWLSQADSSGRLVHQTDSVVGRYGASSGAAESTYETDIGQPHYFSDDWWGGESAVMTALLTRDRAYRLFPVFQQSHYTSNYYYSAPQVNSPFSLSDVPDGNAFELEAASLESHPILAGDSQQAVGMFVPILNPQTIIGLGRAAEHWQDNTLWDAFGVSAADALVPLLTLSNQDLGTPWSRSYRRPQIYVTAIGYLGVLYEISRARPKSAGLVVVEVRAADGSVLLLKDWPITWNLAL